VIDWIILAWFAVLFVFGVVLIVFAIGNVDDLD
jgi:hypothetical protein